MLVISGENLSCLLPLTGSLASWGPWRSGWLSIQKSKKHENFVDEHTLTAAISRIRGKIEVDGLQYIKTVYGMGYMWIGGMQK